MAQNHFILFNNHQNMENCEVISFFEGAKLRFLLAAKSLEQLFSEFIFIIKDFSTTFVAEFGYGLLGIGYL